ncbi:hypothetical protein SHKM778_55370 [Streptomyces sp. KM77-8]|uniref:Uncharacterized protein n=1 Tax=Streptomyces haneummycinicus TaxID=3074435 RepID=A0AAT9HPA1_9ACTN
MRRQWMRAHSDIAVHEAWRLPAADTFRGRRALWWSAGPAGELAVMLVHRRHLERSRYVKGWLAWRPKNPFTGELVTVTGQGSGAPLWETSGSGRATWRYCPTPASCW